MLYVSLDFKTNMLANIIVSCLSSIIILTSLYFCVSKRQRYKIWWAFIFGLAGLVPVILIDFLYIFIGQYVPILTSPPARSFLSAALLEEGVRGISLWFFFNRDFDRRRSAGKQAGYHLFYQRRNNHTDKEAALFGMGLGTSYILFENLLLMAQSSIVLILRLLSTSLLHLGLSGLLGLYVYRRRTEKLRGIVNLIFIFSAHGFFNFFISRGYIWPAYGILLVVMFYLASALKNPRPR